MNIYTGEEAGDNVNVNKPIEIGNQQLIQFQHSLPEDFRERLSSKVITMANGKKNKKGAIKESFNTELIFSQVLCLLGMPRFTSSKAVRKNKVSSCGIESHINGTCCCRYETNTTIEFLILDLLCMQSFNFLSISHLVLLIFDH